MSEWELLRAPSMKWEEPGKPENVRWCNKQYHPNSRSDFHWYSDLRYYTPEQEGEEENT